MVLFHSRPTVNSLYICHKQEGANPRWHWQEHLPGYAVGGQMWGFAPFAMIGCLLARVIICDRYNSSFLGQKGCFAALVPMSYWRSGTLTGTTTMQ